MPEVLRAAAEELRDAARWYEREQRGLGRRFIRTVRAGYLRIDDLPLAWPLLEVPDLALEVRHLPIPPFPYAIVYVAEPRTVVVAVADGRRELGYWAPRLRAVR